VSGLGTSVATFLATPSSANLAAAVTDETGSGALVFATSPTIATPTITTSAVIPLVNGGTAVSSTLTLQSTSGAGTSDAIVFKTASQSERMRILTTGEVGIGTASPSYTLDVKGSGNTAARFTNTGASDNVQIRFRGNQTNAEQWAIGNEITTGGTGRNFDIFDLVASQGRLRIDSSGNVGIGTTSPQVPCDVNGAIRTISATFAAPTSGAGLEIRYVSSLDAASLLSFNRSTGAYKPYLVDASYQAFSISGSEKMRIDSAGNVGIGTASPAEKLNVVGGNIRIETSYGLRFPDSGGAFSLPGNGEMVWGNGQALTLEAMNSDGTIVFTTNNRAERMRITSTGSVGIGTTSPAAQLTVKSATAAIQIDVSASASANPELKLAAVARQFNVGVGGATFATTALQGSYYLYDATAATYRFVINSAGNVGIGVTSFGTSAANVIGIANGTAPTTSPAGMGQLYVEAGALKYRGSSGTVTTLGPA